MTNRHTLVEALRPLGFTSYEAKVYAALVAHGAMNGYELAKASGVPRSMAYETAAKLQGKGAVYALAEDPVRYLAQPSAELLPRLRRATEAQFDRAAAELDKLKPAPHADLVWRIDGSELALAAAESMIDGAHASLTLSIWEGQLARLEPALRRAAARGVTVRMMLFAQAAPQGLGFVYLHHFVDSAIVEARLGARLLVIAADRAEVVVANLGSDAAGWAVRTKDRALVLVAEEYVRHDVILAALTEHVGREVFDGLWRSREDLIPMVLSTEGKPTAAQRHTGEQDMREQDMGEVARG